MASASYDGGSLNNKFCIALCSILVLMMIFSSWPNTFAIRIDSVPASFRHETTAPTDDVEVGHQLRKLNKPALKSILSSDGDIIDCILVSEQPAFDHPLLKGHKIQRAPQSLPKDVSQTSSAAAKGLSTKLRQVWHDSGESCPEHTISVRRITTDDLRQTSERKRYHARSMLSTNDQLPISSRWPIQKPAVAPYTGHEYAIAQSSGTSFYGTSAVFNLWSPSVGFDGEFSLSQLWLMSGAYKDSSLNTIEAGWQVLYGQTSPRLFIYWTSDAYNSTGCYNLMCSGFVQVNNTVVLGGFLSPVSIADGKDQNLIIAVFRDPQSGNWWLSVGGVYVGYWPQSIFTLLGDSGASMLEWGGEIVNRQVNGLHTTTQMGSGRFAESGLYEAAYIRNLEFVDSSFAYQSPSSISPIVTNYSCYDITQNNSDTWGVYFFFGGPGRSSQCP